MFFDTPLWKKISTIYTCCGSVAAGAYIYFLVPRGEAASVGEALDRAGFDGIEKASAADLRKIVAAYKAALKNPEFQKMEDVEIKNEDSDEVVAEKIRGGCRRLTAGGTSSVNNENGRRFCVVPVTVAKTLSQKGIKFLDMVGDKDDGIWEQKAELLIKNGKAGKSMTNSTSKEDKINIIKSSCSDLAGAPTTSGKFKSFIEVAETYCTDKK